MAAIKLFFVSVLIILASLTLKQKCFSVLRDGSVRKWNSPVLRIGHFRVHNSLHFKESLSTKSLLWKSVFIHIEIRTNYHNKNFDSLWKRDPGELGNGLLHAFPDITAQNSWLRQIDWRARTNLVSSSWSVLMLTVKPQLREKKGQKRLWNVLVQP